MVTVLKSTAAVMPFTDWSAMLWIPIENVTLKSDVPARLDFGSGQSLARLVNKSCHL